MLYFTTKQKVTTPTLKVAGKDVPSFMEVLGKVNANVVRKMRSLNVLTAAFSVYAFLDQNKRSPAERDIYISQGDRNPEGDIAEIFRLVEAIFSADSLPMDLSQEQLATIRRVQFIR